MTSKEIAEIGRQCLNVRDYDRLHQLFNELDPPRPEPGAVVWWRVTNDDKWHLGTTTSYGIVPADNHTSCWNWDINGLEYRPARILADDEVAVQVPPKFPDGSDEASLRWHYESNYDWMTDYAGVSITRAEAEAREAE
jgi:hypothetical protein